MGGSNWRDDFKYAWQKPDPEPDEGPGLTWRELAPHDWSGSWNGKLHGTINADGWRPTCVSRARLACRRSRPWAASTPVEAAQVATDEVWASR